MDKQVTNIYFRGMKKYVIKHISAVIVAGTMAYMLTDKELSMTALVENVIHA